MPAKGPVPVSLGTVGGAPMRPRTAAAPARTGLTPAVMPTAVICDASARRRAGRGGQSPLWLPVSTRNPLPIPRAGSRRSITRSTIDIGGPSRSRSSSSSRTDT